ncbi:MAG: Glu/Leu/Phe/Val dehydrogenase [Alphaproteobacteria bacterium]|nr:Glu/Leu/Phe/Val dehydrogenase [Alphaproteobacteria bacterium]
MTRDPFALADTLGPFQILHVHRPALGLKGIVVVDNVACGPAIGGIRMAADASLEECFRLARAMTFKNAAAGLPHGGGKAVIIADPRMPPEAKERHIRAFADAIASLQTYIPGPDMGTDERCMAWVKDEIGRAVGLPRELGGIPLDEIGATGFGLAAAIDVARASIGLELKGARVAIQGYGAVGRHAATFLAGMGAVIVAASDTSGTLVADDGLDIAALTALKLRGGALVDAERGDKRAAAAIIDVPCDIWIPAARPDVIDRGNVERLRTRMVAQGANIPVTPEAEAALAARGVLVLPDFIANAGGVICAACEYAGATQAAALATIDERIRANTRRMLALARERAIGTRQAAILMAEERVRAAMALRRWR